MLNLCTQSRVPALQSTAWFHCTDYFPCDTNAVRIYSNDLITLKKKNKKRKSPACLPDRNKGKLTETLHILHKFHVAAEKKNTLSSFFPLIVVKIVLSVTPPVGTFYLNKSFDCLTDCLSSSLNFCPDSLQQEAKESKRWHPVLLELYKRSKALKPKWAQCTTVFNIYIYIFFFQLVTQSNFGSVSVP